MTYYLHKGPSSRSRSLTLLMQVGPYKSSLPFICFILLYFHEITTMLKVTMHLHALQMQVSHLNFQSYFSAHMKYIMKDTNSIFFLLPAYFPYN